MKTVPAHARAPMKFPFPHLVFLLSALAATWCPGQQDLQPEAPEELRQLPEVVLDRKTEFEVRFQPLAGGDEGVRRFGFAFKTPNLVDGPATWLVVWDHENPDTEMWEVTRGDGKVVCVVPPMREDLGNHPDLAAKFPKGKSVQLLRMENQLLVKATRYQATLAVRGEATPLGISMNVAAGGVGARPGAEVREMEIPSEAVPSAQVMELVENIRKFRGDAEAIAFLETQFALKARQLGNFGALSYKVWDEAQFGTGMEDPAWGSRLYDAAFTSAYRIGHYERAFGLMNNLSARLGGSARFGRLAEVHAILEDAYRKGGMNMDPSSYPDLGPAIPGLPVIRHRDITMKTAWSVEPPAGRRLPRSPHRRGRPEDRRRGLRWRGVEPPLKQPDRSMSAFGGRYMKSFFYRGGGSRTLR